MKIKTKMWCIFLSLILSVCACGKEEIIDSSYENLQEGVKRIEIPLKWEEVCDIKMCGNVVLFETLTSEMQEIFYMEDAKEFPKLPVCSYDYSQKEIIDFTTDGEERIFLIMIDRSDDSINLVRVNTTGKDNIVRSLSSFWQGEKDDVYQWRVRIEKNGNILIASEYGYWILDSQGEIIQKKLWEEKVTCDVLFPEEGCAFIQQLDNIDRVFSEYDMGTGQLKRLNGIASDARFFLLENESRQLFMYTDSEAYIYDISEGKKTRLFDWTDLGIVGENVIGMYGGMETPRCVIVEDNCLYDIQWNGGQSKERVELVLGSIADSTVTRRAVAWFNRTNSDCMITIADYGGEDKDVAVERMYMDILAGEGPDIILLNSECMDERMLGERGILEDLVPYLEHSDVIGKQDMIDSVYNALLTNQKIYMLPTNFRLTGLITKQKWMSDAQGWTVNDILDVLNEQPELCDTAYIDKNAMLELCFSVYFHTSREYDEQTAVLDGAILKKYIQLAELMPQTAVYPAEESVRRDGKLLFEVFYIEDMSTYLYNRSVWGEDSVFTGYPEGRGNGMVIVPDNCYAVNAFSEHKDLAWKFIESFFTDEWQKEVTPNYFFSVCKDIFEEQLQEAMRRKMYMGNDGNQYELPIVQYDLDGETINVYAAGEEDVEQLRKMVNDAVMIKRGDSPLTAIIQEEAAYYFAGDKTIEEVVDIIQNRIQLYMNE